MNNTTVVRGITGLTQRLVDTVIFVCKLWTRQCLFSLE